MSETRISRLEALQLARQILERAERERSQVIDHEAAQGIQYDDGSADSLRIEDIVQQAASPQVTGDINIYIEGTL